ncbi:MAG: DoxX family membrane protein [Planctomycetota bacterium]
MKGLLVETVALLLRLATGVPLVLAGWEKMQAFAWWRDQLAKAELLPADLVGPAAAALPGLEFVVGATLLLGFWHRASAAVAAGLYAVFAVSMTVLWRTGALETCACFGPGSDLEISPTTIAIRFAAAALLVVLAALTTPRLALDRVFLRLGR